MLHNPYNSNYFQVPNPHVPYHGDIPNGLMHGKQIFMSGKFTGHSFKVNFITHSGDYALHFNPRTHEHCVVRNAKFGGSYGDEERENGMPFHHHEDFEIIFKCEDDRFLVAVNGQHCFEFYYRCPLEEISHIEVNGEVHLHSMVFSGGHGHRTHKHNPSEVPFYQYLNGIYPGKMVQIIGVVPHGCGRFVMNLQETDGEDSQHIALHISSRFDDPYEGQAVVIANRQSGNWGEEIKSHSGPFPFHQGARFEMLILVEDDEFKVAVNGRHFSSMGHRNPFSDASFLGVEGDVQILSIREY